MSGPTDPTEAYFDKGLWGWDLTRWRKLPLVWGYSDRKSYVFYSDNLASGSSYVNGAAVPAGEVWVMTIASMQYIGTAPTSLRLDAILGGQPVVLLYQTSVVSLVPYSWAGEVVLKEADYLRGEVVGATAGDDCYVRAGGYIMKVAQ
jgi:hypothetical protein